ncbi:acid phosphatase [Athelia psychrophila]|uniref:Phytase A n=1 Tax=Athelia psychrophila TaxID=1759441 RepID=A0A166QY52_9AGAM|nr:acid phosphatase [Fibularhizoctonia sp. CBS 109695]
MTLTTFYRSRLTSVAARAPSTERPLWSHLTPYLPAAGYQSLPRNCQVTQVNIIQRHGARQPAIKEVAPIQKALDKLRSVQGYSDPKLLFLRNYTHDLGEGDLLPFGAQESSLAGALQYERYSHLVTPDCLPFVRTSSGIRVAHSAGNWTAGISMNKYNPEPLLIIPENLNNTLVKNMCPNCSRPKKQTRYWRSIFASPIAARLNKAAPGAGLGPSDVLYLMTLCPLETVAKGVTSPICALFTEEEYEGFEYYHDLDKYYGFGYGQDLGRVQGVGYVNELLARLTGQPVKDHTQTNRTLDASPTTFPLNRTIYADFSHGSVMVAIYAAIGIFQQDEPLDLGLPDPNRTWVMAKMIPFSGRMVTERVECQISIRGVAARATEYVRILVNDAVQPLKFCGAGRDGLCELEAFVQSQAYARADGDGDFERCYS